jgi:hypothetical protein
MTGLILYTILALSILVLAAWLARGSSPRSKADSGREGDFANCLLDPRFLELADRIFDPTDYRWLHDDMCFPEAARSLAGHRKDLAIQWLRALGRSFKELVRLPEADTDPGEATGVRAGWQLLWLTVRFHLLLSYALLVVHLFGPYHRLLPHLGWIESVRAVGFRKARLGTVEAWHIR